MAILHEVLLVIGAALTVLITISLVVLGKEYAQTGHISLAVLESRPTCEGALCAGARPSHGAPHRPF